MECPDCGITINNVNQNFCETCGFELNIAVKESNEQIKKEKSKRISHRRCC
ncbi:MAG: hypothetical protein HWN81_05630 [Candidatus Lokiarchaeota archaeon]|nr:hypothetical protein [Candidatus Lokiarchaeota archaeon]